MKTLFAPFFLSMQYCNTLYRIDAWFLNFKLWLVNALTAGITHPVFTTGLHMKIPGLYVTPLPLYKAYFLFVVARPLQFWFQSPHNDTAYWIVELHGDIMVFLLVVLAIVAVTILSLVWPAKRRRRLRTKKMPYGVKYADKIGFLDCKISDHNSVVELLWTIIPIVFEILVIIPSFILHYAVAQVHPYDVEGSNVNTANAINVTGSQWFWVYGYTVFLNNFAAIPLPWMKYSPGGSRFNLESYMIDSRLASSGTGFAQLEVDFPMYIFKGLMSKLLVTSDDVIHSWAVPSLGVKVDACPGRVSEAVIQIKDLGIFYGQCSELCGYYHGNMPIVVVSRDSQVIQM